MGESSIYMTSHRAKIKDKPANRIPKIDKVELVATTVFRFFIFFALNLSKLNSA